MSETVSISVADVSDVPIDVPSDDDDDDDVLHEMSRRHAKVVKEVHAQLRIKIKRSKRVDGEDDGQEMEIWREHLRDEEKLERYSKAMKDLATKGKWRKKEREEKRESRIVWINEKIRKYFREGDEERFEKRRIRKMGSLRPEEEKREKDSEQRQRREGKVSVLDVGSCFNPFSLNPDLAVTAIDIAPAEESVWRCDFLNVDIGPGEDDEDGIRLGKGKQARELIGLPVGHFDAVIFCLLLEYLPSPTLRYEAVLRARDVLGPSGLLFIVTPDSCHQGRNMGVIKRWKICLGQLGLARVYYEKLTHVHCMAFAKAEESQRPALMDEVMREAGKMGLEMDSIDPRIDLMIIPQDSNIEEEDGDDKAVAEEYDQQEIAELFSGLPSHLL